MTKQRVIGFFEQLKGLEEMGNDSEGRWLHEVLFEEMAFKLKQKQEE